MSWGIAETASEIEKIKSESADYLNGLNSCGVIDWNAYNYAFDFYADLLMKAYEQGKKDAQPDPCDDPRADVYYLAEKIGIHQLYALVVALRREPDPCEDAVSREQVLKLFSTHDGKYLYEAIQMLPSVTPKPRTGKWIINSDGYYPYCSECKAEPKSGEMTDFCPNCGADMRGERDGR